MKHEKDRAPRSTNMNEEPALFEEKPEEGKMWKRIVILLVFLSAVAFLCWPKGYIKGEGLIQARRFTQIGLTSAGILRELYHKRGEHVQAGDPIARFENPELKRKREASKIQLEVLEHERLQRQKRIEFLRREKERKFMLYENGVIGRTPYEEMELDYTEAQESLCMREKEIESLKDEIAYVDAQMDALILKAPFTGMLLTDPEIQTGNLLQGGDFVLEIADPESFFLETLIPERKVEQVAVGNVVRVRFRAFPWAVYPGEILKIHPRTTVRVEKVFDVKYVIPCEIKLNEVPAGLKYGMRAWVKIGRKKKGIFPSRQGLKPDGQTIDLRVVENGHRASG